MGKICDANRNFDCKQGQMYHPCDMKHIAGFSSVPVLGMKGKQCFDY